MADLLDPRDREPARDERLEMLADDAIGGAGPEPEVVPTWAMSLAGMACGGGLAYGFAVWRNLDVSWVALIGAIFGSGVGWLMAKRPTR